MALSFFTLAKRRVCFFVLLLYMFFFYMPYALFIRMWTTKRSHVPPTQQIWSGVCTWVCRLELVKDPSSAAVSTNRRTMLLGNHRNFTDFFLHDVLTEYSANFLSRALVGVVFFGFAINTYFENTLWFFVRGKAREDPEMYFLPSFYQWIDNKFNTPRNVRNNIVVYPEGHRNLAPDPLPLRTGMLRYAYSRKLALQIYVGHGYDETLNQLRWTAEWKRCTRVYYAVDKVIETKEFDTFDDLMKVVNERFVALFYRVRDRARLENKT